MHLVLITALLLAAVFGPRLWVGYVMRRHGRDIPGLPGTGGELATHLIDAHGLDGVTVEPTDAGDHYDPDSRTVRLSPSNYEGKSLTAIAVAAHEVGHAIQHQQGHRSLTMRTRLAPLVARLGQLSVVAAGVAPLLGVITRHPVPFSLMLALGLSGLVARTALHAVTLPTEWDASFGKALPILKAGRYIADGEERAVKRVLFAAALTYFAAALADILNLARWAAIFLRR
jgi:Zn-dependent membrane protease YugP